MKIYLSFDAVKYYPCEHYNVLHSSIFDIDPFCTWWIHSKPTWNFENAEHIKIGKRFWNVMKLKERDTVSITLLKKSLGEAITSSDKAKQISIYS